VSEDPRDRAAEERREASSVPQLRSSALRVPWAFLFGTRRAEAEDRGPGASPDTAYVKSARFGVRPRGKGETE